MKILGIDPGSNIVGYGVIHAQKLRFSHQQSGIIRVKGEMNARITTIFREINRIADDHRPDVAVIERVFMRPDRPNPDAAIKLGQARGAIISAVGILEIPIVEYSANQIKKTVVGRGHAAKQQIAFMVKHLLKLAEIPDTDSADGLACAICHAYHIC